MTCERLPRPPSRKNMREFQREFVAGEGCQGELLRQ
jgi:hypothetical protein